MPDTNESFSNFLKQTEEDKIEGRLLLDGEELGQIPQTQRICLKIFEGANSMIQSESFQTKKKKKKKKIRN